MLRPRGRMNTCTRRGRSKRRPYGHTLRQRGGLIHRKIGKLDAPADVEWGIARIPDEVPWGRHAKQAEREPLQFRVVRAPVVKLADGREELIAEVANAPLDVREFVSRGVAELMQLRHFNYGVEGALLGADAATRAAEVTVPRFQEIDRQLDGTGGA